MANLVQFDIHSEWTRLFADSSFSKYKLTEEVTYNSNSKLLESVLSTYTPGTYTEGNFPLTKIASKNIKFETYEDQYGNTQVRIKKYVPTRCPDRDYRVVGIIFNNTNHAKCNEPWDNLPSTVKPNTVTYDCENGWLECIADPDRWFKKFLDTYDTNKTFIQYETYNNNMTPMYYVLGVGPMMNNGTTLDKTNFRDYWCNNKICLFIYTIESNVGKLSELVKPPYEFIKFYNESDESGESDVDFITNDTLPQLTNYINDYYEIKKVTNTGNTDSYTYIQNKGNTFIKPANVVSTSVFGPFTIKRISPSSKYLNNYTPKTNDDGEYIDNIISILTSSSNNQSLSGARFSKKFGSRNNTEVLSSSNNNTEESTEESPQFEIDEYNVYITSYYDFSVNNPYIRFGEGITEVYCEIEDDIKLSDSSLYKYAGQNDTINTFINNNEEGWINAVGSDKANEIKDFYNGFNWTQDPTPDSDKMLPPYNEEKISNPKKHVPCRIIPVWNGSAYDWILYCGSIEIVKVSSGGTITIKAGYEDKLYTNNDVTLTIETKTGYVKIDK